jgi:methionyl-tRNA formyltransferase
MGTPEFAVASLDALINAGCNIVGVITAPDKPAGRGMQLQQSAVKKYALGKKLHILQPEKLKNPVFIEELGLLNADVQVVIAFRMLPEIVWNMPPLGTINVHASLLPDYRGAAPINWAIINGEKETGITTFKLQQEIDTGNILLQEKTSIGENETAGELHDKLKELGANLLVKTIQHIADGSLNEIPQSAISNQQPAMKQAPKISTETCNIDWNKSTEDAFNLIRGLSPYPTAFTYLNNKMLKIFFSEKEVTPHHHATGSVHSDGKSYLKFACSDGFIHCTDIQLQGKKRMNIENFLRGYRINN